MYVTMRINVWIMWKRYLLPVILSNNRRMSLYYWYYADTVLLGKPLAETNGELLLF